MRTEKKKGGLTLLWKLPDRLAATLGKRNVAQFYLGRSAYNDEADNLPMRRFAGQNHVPQPIRGFRSPRVYTA